MLIHFVILFEKFNREKPWIERGDCSNVYCMEVNYPSFGNAVPCNEFAVQLIWTVHIYNTVWQHYFTGLLSICQRRCWLENGWVISGSRTPMMSEMMMFTQWWSPTRSQWWRQGARGQWEHQFQCSFPWFHGSQLGQRWVSRCIYLQHFFFTYLHICLDILCLILAAKHVESFATIYNKRRW